VRACVNECLFVYVCVQMLCEGREGRCLKGVRVRAYACACVCACVCVCPRLLVQALPEVVPEVGDIDIVH